MSNTTSDRVALILLAVVGVAIWMLLMIAVGGVALLATISGSAVVIVSTAVLWMTGRRQRAGRLLAGWGTYVLLYLGVSTVIGISRGGHVVPVGREICADSGCFAVDQVDRAGTAYTVFWHLASNNTEQRRFPGNGLQFYMFDDRGRTFPESSDLARDPLDITLAAGQTVRESMTFAVPADARGLLLTARYRPLTFQSLLPGELTLVPRRPEWMIRIE